MRPSNIDFSRPQQIAIGNENEGQRIDNFLISRLKGVPKSRIYRILRKGEVRINKGRIRPDYRLKEGDIVRIPPIRVAEAPFSGPPPALLARRLADTILYEDDELYMAAVESARASSKPCGRCVRRPASWSWFTVWTGIHPGV